MEHSIGIKLDEFGIVLYEYNAALAALRKTINLSDIDELGKVVLRLLYGLTTNQRMSPEEIEKLLGVSRRRIKEIESDAFDYLGFR